MSMRYRVSLVYGVSVPSDAFDSDDDIEDAIEGTSIDYVNMTDMDGDGTTVLTAVSYQVDTHEGRFGVWHQVDITPDSLAQWDLDLARVARRLRFSAEPSWFMGMSCG